MQANNAELLVAKSPVYMRNNQVERKIIWANSFHVGDNNIFTF